MLDIKDITSFADYFVIMSAESNRQIASLQDDLEKGLKHVGVSLHHREGTSDSGWVLLDFSDVIVHIFSVDRRDFYQLDELWSGATRIITVL